MVVARQEKRERLRELKCSYDHPRTSCKTFTASTVRDGHGDNQIGFFVFIFIYIYI